MGYLEAPLSLNPSDREPKTTMVTRHAGTGSENRCRAGAAGTPKLAGVKSLRRSASDGRAFIGCWKSFDEPCVSKAIVGSHSSELLLRRLKLDSARRRRPGGYFVWYFSITRLFDSG
jgi:hypothetical protein